MSDVSGGRKEIHVSECELREENVSECDRWRERREGVGDVWLVCSECEGDLREFFLFSFSFFRTVRGERRYLVLGGIY